MTTKKLTALSAICALALGAGIAGCDPGSDSVDEANSRAAGTSGSEEAKPDYDDELDDDDVIESDTDSEGLVDDDTFGEEGIIDDQTFGEEGLIDDDL